MPLQINTISIQRLINRVKRDNEFWKKHDRQEVELLGLTEKEMYVREAERIAILKALEEMKKNKTVRVVVEQIKLF